MKEMLRKYKNYQKILKVSFRKIFFPLIIMSEYMAGIRQKFANLKPVPPVDATKYEVCKIREKKLKIAAGSIPLVHMDLPSKCQKN
jgi:hypothetical protein